MTEINQSENVSFEEKTRYLCFSLGQEEYAIPLLSVLEVIAIPETTPVPFSPGHVIGVMNLRGQVITVMDLKQKLGSSSDPKAESSVVIICNLGKFTIGMVVDAIQSVLPIAKSEITEKPEVKSGRPTDYIKGVYRKDSKMILILDPARSLGLEDQNLKLAA